MLYAIRSKPRLVDEKPDSDSPEGIKKWIEKRFSLNPEF